MTNKWKMHKIGLVDFWYYDEQEFHFLDGRMLLRGANGSGKSVTMQSFIPLLLDGNMRPERLDPFGSRARKMENYLLEEGDERSERTGYLYMEFRRKDSESYMTIGIGMRARKGKKLDSWYFAITDGRRIGKDIFLYKDVSQKIAFTKTELKNRIGEGGKVFESQKEYTAFVNQLLFGFETIEEYKEMLELLIQLRTPKLSKDFKPTVINDILGNSLQTLSEDDLRPMSEAIENMDGLKTNLDNLKESLKAAKQINRVYRQYNQSVLYQKAMWYREETQEYSRLQKHIKEYENRIRLTEEEEKDAKKQYETLVEEQKVRNQEKSSLEEHDATKLKEQEQQLQKEMELLWKTIEDKKRQKESKESKRIQVEEQLRICKEEKDKAWDEIEDILEEMKESIENTAFDEFAFMAEELKKSPESSYEFSTHRELLQRYMGQVQAGIAILEKEENIKRQYDDQLKLLDEYRGERDQAERELLQYENLLEETKEEFVEMMYQWEKKNQQIKLEEATMQEMTRLIHGYQYGMDEVQLLEPIRRKRYALEEEIQAASFQIKNQKEQLENEYNQAKEELLSWQNQKDPEPFVREEVAKNRELLKENGISYYQFYKTIDFADTLDEQRRNDLEEALLEMGVLDALIVAAEDREKILSLDMGVCDKYIFSDVETVKQNVEELLEIDNDANDILFYQKISKVLSAIGNNSENLGNTWIGDDGHFKMGVLEGTITHQYQAKYIGVKAREMYRMQQIETLEEICNNLQSQINQLEEKLRIYAVQREQLLEEEKRFPSLDDMKVAAKEANQKDQQLSIKNHQVKQQQEKVEIRRKALDEVRLEVQKVCAKVYLTVRLDVFRQAREDLNEYQYLLTKLQISHQTFLSKLQEEQSKKSYIDDIFQDLDEILYDINQTEKKYRQESMQLEAVKEQLKLTNYEEIKDQLDHCVRRLTQLPGEIETFVEKKTSLKKDLEQLAIRLEQEEKKQSEQENTVRFLEKVYRGERELHYVEEEIKEDIKADAKNICKTYGALFEKKDSKDIFTQLQEIFQQNRMYLREYNLSLTSLFQEMSQEESIRGLDVKRIDIVGKYRGVNISFEHLLEKLDSDVEEQTRLLSDKDRELFEDILANTISKKIRGKIQGSQRWVKKMNELMESMETSSGLSLSLKWKSKRAQKEEQMDTRTLVQILQKDAQIMREDEVEQLSAHFRSKIDEARKIMDDTNNAMSFHAIMKDVLDYRKWFEFQLEYQKTGEKKKELTDRMFFTFSGGEKAMAMYVPLFSAVVAKYQGAREDAPRIISLDEAFAGVDEMNIKDMFRLMVEFEFDFMMNSQILWGDYETVPVIAIYQLLRPENAKYVTVIPYVWNGNVRTAVRKIGDQIEQA